MITAQVSYGTQHVSPADSRVSSTPALTTTRVADIMDTRNEPTLGL